MKIFTKLTAFVLSATLFMTICFCVAPKAFAIGVQGVVINEVCSSNKGENGNITDGVEDDGSYCDWVELYNTTSNTVDLTGWGISDSKKDFFLFAFPSGQTISPNGYLLVYCSKSFKEGQSALCAKLGISADGEKIYLTNPDSSAQDIADTPALASDTTYARFPDGSDEFKVLYPSPNKTNSNSEEVIVNAPEFSQESGMFKSEFTLTITSTDKDAVIYYTTDGSDPTDSDTRIEYTGEITVKDRTGDKNVLAAVSPDDICISYSGSAPTDNEVDKGTVIRAVCLVGTVYSKAVTKSYFVGDKVCSYGDIPVLSVTTDYDNLFDYNTGIYCNGKVWDDFQVSNPGVTQSWLAQTNSTQRGKEWERECHIDLIESDGSVAISQDCGMRIQGGSSRTSLQKSMRFYARKDYGESYFNYPLFSDALDVDGNVIDKYKTFVVRNGGNDSVYLKYTDNFIQNLVADRDIETLQGRGTLVFLDGEYWGVFMMQEDYKEEYFEEKYGVDKDDVVMVKCGEIELGNDEDIALYNDMVNYVNNYSMTEERFKKVSKMIDLQSFADYMAVELYICNADWPNNNYALWRTRSEGGEGVADGRWRFILYDTEYSTYQYNATNTSYKYDNFDLVYRMGLGQTMLDTMFWRLKNVDSFKEMFVKAVLDMRNTNFKYTSVSSKLSKTNNYYNRYLLDYRTRFHNSSSWNLSDRLSQLQTFFNKRPGYVLEYLNSAAKLKAEVESFYLKSDTVNGGNVKMNSTVVDFSDYPSTGLYCKYFDTYSTDFTAIPDKGYVFKKWTGAVNSAEQFNESVSLSKGTYGDITACFVKESDVLYGDVNADGIINALDLLQMKKYIAKFNVGIFKIASDVNLDSKYNAVDLLMIKKHIVGFDIVLGK